jgi:hypothetical protein
VLCSYVTHSSTRSGRTSCACFSIGSWLSCFLTSLKVTALIPTLCSSCNNCSCASCATAGFTPKGLYLAELRSENGRTIARMPSSICKHKEGGNHRLSRHGGRLGHLEGLSCGPEPVQESWNIYLYAVGSTTPHAQMLHFLRQHDGFTNNIFCRESINWMACACKARAEL